MNTRARSIVLFSMMVALGIATTAAGGLRLEVRLLQLSGAEPHETTLKRMVEDPGAQATEMLRIPIKHTPTTEVRKLTPYRYASEFTAAGTPSGFITKELGWVGRVAIARQDGVALQVSLDIMTTMIGTPHVVDLHGVQVITPVFTTIKTPEKPFVLAEGEWRFSRAVVGPKTFYWAIRVSNS